MWLYETPPEEILGWGIHTLLRNSEAGLWVLNPKPANITIFHLKIANYGVSIRFQAFFLSVNSLEYLIQNANFLAHYPPWSTKHDLKKTIIHPLTRANIDIIWSLTFCLRFFSQRQIISTELGFLDRMLNIIEASSFRTWLLNHFWLWASAKISFLAYVNDPLQRRIWFRYNFWLLLNLRRGFLLKVEGFCMAPS